MRSTHICRVSRRKFQQCAYNMTRPHPTGQSLVLCIEKALAQCGVAKEDVNYVNVHAPSTIAGDSLELKAFHQVFGRNPELRINSSMIMTGYLIGASGAIEAIAVVKAIETGWIHPNVNLEDPDEYLSWRSLVKDKKERLDVKVALSNSFGFGGHYSFVKKILMNFIAMVIEVQYQLLHLFDRLDF